MKSNRINAGWLMLLALSPFTLQPSTAQAQGTAFTYQGRLNANGSPAPNGLYDFQFAVWDALAGGNQLATTNKTTSVTNGLFMVTLDCPGVFTGPARWLEVDARTNGNGTFTTLAPREQILATPYAIMANNATTATSATSATSATTASSFSGSLFGDVTGPQNATAVGTVGGVSAANVASGANAANNATSANIASRIVQRDGSGNFSAQTITLSGDLALPSTSGSSAGVLSIGGAPFLHAYGSANIFVGQSAGNFTMTGLGNTAYGYLALVSNTSGNYNTANGCDALYFNTSGFDNTAHGSRALGNNTSGAGNTANGSEALESNTTGSMNTANGWMALESNTSGSENTAVGDWPLFLNTSGSYNTANGAAALWLNTSGSNNIALGYQAGYNILGSSNIDIGNPGFSTDTNIIRIGNSQSQTFIAGIINGNGGGLTNLNASQLSSGTIGLAQLPGAVLTNNENNVTFNGAVTITNIHTPASRDFSLQAGNGSSSAGGNVCILAGSGIGGYTGGNILLLPGTGTPNGSVGIGTTTPQFPLDIFSGSGEARINLNASGGRLGQINRRADRFEVLSTDAITLAPNSGVEAVRISSNGNVGIGTNAPAYPLEMASGAYCSAAGMWTSVSDRNAKEGFAPIVPGEVLAKVAALPITQWKYKIERDGIKHIGPVSQDFHATFGLGDSEQAIGTVDETGVALAAIQGLNQKLNDKDAEIQGLKQSVAELKAMVEKLAGK